MGDGIEEVNGCCEESEYNDAEDEGERTGSLGESEWHSAGGRESDSLWLKLV